MAFYDIFANLTYYINVYDVYRKLNDGNGLERHLESELLGSSIVGGEVKTYPRYYTSKQYTPWLYKGKLGKNLPVHRLYTPYSDWINRADVRQLLNIPEEV